MSDIEQLLCAEALSPRIQLSGHVYDVATGLVETVVHAQPIEGMRT